MNLDSVFELSLHVYEKLPAEDIPHTMGEKRFPKKDIAILKDSSPEKLTEIFDAYVENFFREGFKEVMPRTEKSKRVFKRGDTTTVVEVRIAFEDESELMELAS